MTTETIQASMRKAKTWALRGTIVTMNQSNDLFDDGLVIIDGGVIVNIISPAELPDDFKDIEVIETTGVIYPGLIDLHNHLAYNIMPLWQVPKPFKSRDQWRGYTPYKTDVYQPVANVLSVYTEPAKATARFIEAKALMGGVCTGQGIGKRTKKGDALLIGALRNVEMPLNDDLPAAGGTVMDVRPNPEGYEELRKRLANPKLHAYLYHLSEGVDKISRQYYLNLRDNNLINEKLVGVHSLGLEPDDLKLLASKGAKVVWSPYSNLLLYGKTLNLKALKESNVIFSIGCDWSPSGSKNLLEEAKVAWQVNLDQQSPFEPKDIVAPLTSAPAKILGWESALGNIEKGMLADLLVLEKSNADVYLNLIMATEKSIKLVLIDGIARFGSAELMKTFPIEAGQELEDISCDGEVKKLYLYHPLSELNTISFTQAQKRLTTIMNDLKAFTDANAPGISPFEKNIEKSDTEVFELILDDDMAPIGGTEKFFADAVMKNSIELDQLFPGDGSYLKQVESQLNLPVSVKEFLIKCYRN